MLKILSCAILESLIHDKHHVLDWILFCFLDQVIWVDYWCASHILVSIPSKRKRWGRGCQRWPLCSSWQRLHSQFSLKILRTWWRLPHTLAFAQHWTCNASRPIQKLYVPAIDIFGLLNVPQTQTVCWWKGTVNGANVLLIPNHWRDLDRHPFRWMTPLIYFTQHQF